MSELKSFIVLYDGKFIRAYKESEADKVIARNKYKRCLAMAKWCKTSALCDEGLGAFKYRDWYRKWYKRWLTLADKYKDGNV